MQMSDPESLVYEAEFWADHGHLDASRARLETLVA